MIHSTGISLIELIISIIVIGIVAGSLLPAFSTALEGAPEVEYSTQAITYAKERMEIILGQKQIKGFDSFSDPCAGGSPPTVCTDTGDYTITSTIVGNWNGDTNYKMITVGVSGPSSAEIEALVSNY